ncbi:MAG: hypothetical protein LCH26_01990 [Proteobacteria bacterium]|nr:hypothetical protein [Pseudomonadota bacterium]
MTTKHLFLSMALCAGLNLANASSSSGSSANNSPSFEYETQVFKRYAASNLDESLPSLAQLYQDAKARKTHLDSLFTYLDTHKTADPTLELFLDNIDFLQRARERNIPEQDLPDDVMLLGLLKTDYTVERDLVTYFVSALEKMASSPPTQAQMEELYAQTVHTTRLNLHSLAEGIFSALNMKYPDVFMWQTSGGAPARGFNPDKLAAIEDKLNAEDRAYVAFFQKISSDSQVLHEVDTVEITRQTRALFDLKKITNPFVIFEINSLSFYLNVERALLAACSSLHFEPKKFGFHKGAATLKDRFILSALQDYHCSGLLNNAGSRLYKPTELALLNRSKDKLLALMLKDEANKAIDTMLSKLGIKRTSPTLATDPSSNKGQKPTPQKGKNSGKKNAKKPKGKLKQSKTKSASLAQGQRTEVAAAPLPNPLLLAQEEWDIDESQALLLDAEQTDEDASFNDDVPVAAPAQRSYLGALASSTSQSSSHVARNVPHLDDYLFKRNVAWTQQINRATYTFNGQPFEMEGTVFPHDQLLRVKELTGHKPGQAKLPNLASAHLRFHYTVGGIDKSYDFVPQERYLSGGFRFARNETYRTTAHIQNAYHNALSPQDQRAFLMENPVARSQRIAQVTTQALETHVAKGPWNINSADSEGILLLDLTKHLPRYLGQLAALEDAPLHIQGVVLGVSTYRDPCWRCRNLLQGWQWGLENALTVASQQNALTVTVARGLPTLVYGFGEVKPNSHDFFPPHLTNEETVLTSTTNRKDPSATHKLRLVSMRH